jgi:hypothetical protein
VTVGAVVVVVGVDEAPVFPVAPLFDEEVLLLDVEVPPDEFEPDEVAADPDVLVCRAVLPAPGWT